MTNPTWWTLHDLLYPHQTSHIHPTSPNLNKPQQHLLPNYKSMSPNLDQLNKPQWTLEKESWCSKTNLNIIRYNQNSKKKQEVSQVFTHHNLCTRKGIHSHQFTQNTTVFFYIGRHNLTILMTFVDIYIYCIQTRSKKNI